MYRKYIKILKNIFIFFNKQNIVKILYFLSCLKKNTKYALLKGKDFIDTGVFNIVRQNKYLIQSQNVTNILKFNNKKKKYTNQFVDHTTQVSVVRHRLKQLKDF